MNFYQGELGRSQFWQRQNDRNKKHEWLSGTQRGDGLTAKRQERILEEDETILYLDCGGSNIIVHSYSFDKLLYTTRSKLVKY